MHGNLLAQAFVYLAAAVVAVPLAKRLGLGAVLGYLLAGIALGPFALGLVGSEGKDVMHFAEFGVVMMLFLVGLELRPSVLWRLRRSILGLGGAQVALTAIAVLGIAVAVGLPWRPGVALGLIFAGSSTAIVLQSLEERGLRRTPGGEGAFSVLLFQDIAVIPILAVLPLLAVTRVAAVAAGGRPPWMGTLAILGAVAGVVGAGRFLVGPLYRFLAKARLREAFTAATLALVIGITLVMELVGLSPALGTFVAGVVLADSEYRHELEADLEPFKGLLLGVFFIAVGASIDFHTVAARPGLIAALVPAVMVVKGVVLFTAGGAFGLDRRARWVLACSLAQIGEFGFVLLAFARQSGVLDEETVAPLVAVTALTMLATPLVLAAFARVVLPRFAEPPRPAREADEITPHDGGVVIAGFGRFGQIVGRLLRASGVPTTVLDVDPDIIDLVRRVGLEAHYGDASRLDLLHAAGCDRARLFVLAVDDPEKSLEIAHMVRAHFPRLPIVARARDRRHHARLAPLGLRAIVRETFGSALDAGEHALVTLGFRAHQAERLARSFERHDEAALALMVQTAGQSDDVRFATARRALAETERLMDDERRRKFGGDHAWDNEVLRADGESRG
jgi:monovalent cation:proton antiporter-2 (CPA2) family protein